MEKYYILLTYYKNIGVDGMLLDSVNMGFFIEAETEEQALEEAIAKGNKFAHHPSINKTLFTIRDIAHKERKPQ